MMTIKHNIGNKEYSKLNATTSQHKGDSFPVEQVSYNDVSLWKNGLNELSKMNNLEVQQILQKLLPGHKQGHQYSRPTEAQWEFVSRLGGLSDSNYSFGNRTDDFDDYVVYRNNSDLKTQPVGSKKPVFFNGKPIYDIHGNVWKWIEDWHVKDLIGGIDPQGPKLGNFRVLRGGSWAEHSPQNMCSGSRSLSASGSSGSSVGFRLLRIIP
jgi:formylglycine-generating enzyme required for sulfatase activity